MNMKEEYQVENIIIETAKENRDIHLNELKRIVKNRIREKLDKRVASEVGIEDIFNIISKNRHIIYNNQNNKKAVKGEKRSQQEIKER